jgi:hypothetical protein
MNPLPSNTLNINITLAKLLQALKKLQSNKATSFDGMKVEFILDARELLHMPLLTMFNYFSAEGFLEAFSTWVVHALFKGGNAFEFDNYRGTTVGLNNMGCVPRVKLGFTKIIALLTNFSYCGL